MSVQLQDYRKCHVSGGKEVYLFHRWVCFQPPHTESADVYAVVETPRGGVDVVDCSAIQFIDTNHFRFE